MQKTIFKIHHTTSGIRKFKLRIQNPPNILTFTDSRAHVSDLVTEF